MNLGILLATFGLVIPAELPDKTFISTIVLASRHRPFPVWVGGASALTVQAAFAVVAGRLLALLPQTTVQIVVATLFILGAAYLLFMPEKEEQERGESLASNGTTGPDPSGSEAALADQVARRAPSFEDEKSWRIALTTFSVVALAEFGDITQILIANLTAHYHEGLSVFVGATLGFMVVSAIGVIGGRAIIRVVPLGVVRRVSGGVLLGLGIYTIVGLA